jgi:protein phosphatase
VDGVTDRLDVPRDCELMPWSSKAQELLRQQYAPVGNAGIQALRV